MRIISDLVNPLTLSTDDKEAKVRKARELKSNRSAEEEFALSQLRIDGFIPREETLKAEQWGKTPDGRIVLLDYGYDYELSSQYNNNRAGILAPWDQTSNNP